MTLTCGSKSTKVCAANIAEKDSATVASEAIPATGWNFSTTSENSPERPAASKALKATWPAGAVPWLSLTEP